MRPFHLPIELRRPGLDVDVPNAMVGEVPVELGLKFMPPVGSHRMHPNRELLDHVVEEVEGVLLGVPRRDPEGADARGIVNGGVLVAGVSRVSRRGLTLLGVILFPGLYTKMKQRRDEASRAAIL